ncbi:hypothetical protein DAD186_17560 [Dermabacter vaginalis]|uniref:Uncharacterized protein n=1 Tax=Dermabacter vaginalis TaxID=1630135 RepID=A0A1B0ZK28_9MICO|nr:hypothetical protein DAD186_17560 [Dermabacter vaginalis]
MCANVTCATNNQSRHGSSLSTRLGRTSPKSLRKSHAATKNSKNPAVN